jgi:hypothetical protein
MVLWPGLARLWRRGEWRGLALAIGGAALLNVTLVAWWIWPEWLSASLRWILTAITIAAWLLGAIEGRRARRRWLEADQSDPHRDLFLAARGEYLRGQASATETLLKQLLAISPDDVEARLMQATLYRHQRRHSEAREQLRRLQRWNRAAHWNQEIRHEWECLAQSLATRESSDRGATDGADAGRQSIAASREITTAAEEEDAVTPDTVAWMPSAPDRRNWDAA